MGNKIEGQGSAQPPEKKITVIPQSQFQPIAEIAFKGNIPAEWPKKIEVKGNSVFNDGKEFKLGPNGELTPKTEEELKQNGFTISEINGQTNIIRNYE